MPHRMKMLTLLAAVLVVPIATVLAAGQTAKSALPQVVAAGKKWQSDAALVSLSPGVMRSWSVQLPLPVETSGEFHALR